jgi:uncharacterized repeat protein (TIGR01451 family)
VPLGEPLTETITITNDGPATATGVEITDVLGAAAEVIAVMPGSASCRSVAPLECSLNALLAGSSQTIELSLRPLRRERLTDTATVSADQLDPNLANNLAKTSATVARRATSARLREPTIEFGDCDRPPTPAPSGAFTRTQHSGRGGRSLSLRVARPGCGVCRRPRSTSLSKRAASAATVALLGRSATLTERLVARGPLHDRVDCRNAARMRRSHALGDAVACHPEEEAGRWVAECP